MVSGTIGTLDAPRGHLTGRIKISFEGVTEVKARYQPQTAPVEIVFVNVNLQSMLLLGQARGAALAELTLGNRVVTEYTALQMKKAVVGHGLATKVQVQETFMPATPKRCRPNVRLRIAIARFKSARCEGVCQDAKCGVRCGANIRCRLCCIA